MWKTPEDKRPGPPQINGIKREGKDGYKRDLRDRLAKYTMWNLFES